MQPADVVRDKNKQVLIPPHTWNYHLIWSKMIQANHKVGSNPHCTHSHQPLVPYYDSPEENNLQVCNLTELIQKRADSLDERFTNGGDKGTAELTLHLIPTCNPIRNTDAKGTATHKQRSLATQGRQSAKPCNQPTNLSTLTFSPLLLSYLIWLNPAGPSLGSVSARSV